MSYGVSLADLFRMGALYTDKILRGRKPEDLPIAQPVTFEFVINLKTVKAIGLEIPASVIGRADEVIEWAAICCSAYVADWALIFHFAAIEAHFGNPRRSGQLVNSGAAQFPIEQ
jgi:ABC transporter substrate binding protein